MKAEQDMRVLSNFRSFQRFRSLSGTSLDMALAKSALITTASAFKSPVAVRTPTAFRPETKISSTGVFSRISAPSCLAIRPSAVVTDPHPPTG